MRPGREATIQYPLSLVTSKRLPCHIASQCRRNEDLNERQALSKRTVEAPSTKGLGADLIPFHPKISEPSDGIYKIQPDR